MTASTSEPVKVAAEHLNDLRSWAREAGRLRALFADRAGPDPDPTLTTLLAALDVGRHLGDGDPPDGSVLVDADRLADLERDAESGRNVRRDALLASAVREGRIPVASRQHWAVLLDGDPNAEMALASIPRGTIPVAPRGYSGNDEQQERDLYVDLYGGT